MWPDKGLPVRCGRCCWVPAHRGTQEERWVSISTEEQTTRAWRFWISSTPPGGKDAQIKSYSVRRMCLKEKQRVWTQKDGNFRTLTHMGEPRDPPPVQPAGLCPQSTLWIREQEVWSVGTTLFWWGEPPQSHRRVWEKLFLSETLWT